MATAPRIITLNLGSQTIGLAEFQLQPNAGLLCQNFRQREIMAEPKAEGMRNEEIAAALGEMVEELRLKKSQVNFAVPGQSVFTRFVKLPIVEEEKIERIISFEAQQNVPFPIDEVIWDYQLVGGGATEQMQVVLVAIKSELLDQMNDSVEGTGLRLRIVDVAPMALYNAFRFNYPDLSGRGCSLLVDMGARTTNLLFIEPERIFSRSVPIGGASITTAIMKEFGETFAAAEVRKKRDGFVSLGGAYLEPSDPSVARVSKIVGGTMTRLHAEVMRSISHYRGQQQGHAPERVFLCGGSATTAYTREFLSEKLQLPVEFFNPLRNVALGPSAPAAELTRSAHLLGELVGLALRTVSGCPMELSLRPEKVTHRHDLEKRRPMLAMAAACVVLAVLGWAGYYARAARVMHESLNQLQTKIDLMHAAEGQLAKLKKETTSLNNLAAPLIAVVDDRSFWAELLQDLNTRLPKQDIWITELIPTSDSKPIVENDARVTTPLATTGIQATSTQSRTRTRTGEPVIDGILIRGLYLFNPKQEEVVTDYFAALSARRFLGSSRATRRAWSSRASRTTRTGRSITSCTSICANRCHCHEGVVSTRSVARRVSARFRHIDVDCTDFAVDG